MGKISELSMCKIEDVSVSFTFFPLRSDWSMRAFHSAVITLESEMNENLLTSHLGSCIFPVGSGYCGGTKKQAWLSTSVV